MQGRIRIIKHSQSTNMLSPTVNEVEKSDEQRERETKSTVKRWIAEWKERDSALKNAAFLLVRSLEENTQQSTRPLVVSNG